MTQNNVFIKGDVAESQSSVHFKAGVGKRGLAYTVGLKPPLPPWARLI